MTTLTEEFKQHSHTTHQSVDDLVMSMQPFASQDNYRKFLQAQHEFHKTVNPINYNVAIQNKIAGLTELDRFQRVKNDMQDLEVAPFSPEFNSPAYNEAEAIGWLYCVEGSNMGAAILYKHAGKIDLNDDFGASHLAAHQNGRRRHWEEVKSRFDALELSEADKEAAKKGVSDAFAYFKQIIRTVYGVPA